MNDLSACRREIDAVDDELVRLLEKRMELSAQVAEAKRRSGTAVFDPQRERDILARLESSVRPENAALVRDLFVALFGASKAVQRSRIAAGEVPGLRLAVVGLGLIGGSFYKAAKRAGIAVTGLHHGDGPEALAEADLVLVCLPPPAIVPWVSAHAAAFKRGAVVVDICGVKEKIMREMAAVPRDGWTFVGGHPMAGREVAGYANSLADLFDGASMILTPFAETPQTVLDVLSRFFRAVGFARVVVTAPDRHDEMIAFTSQLCHVIATAYSRDSHVRESVGFSAGSYADMTRIATQNADDWSALFLSNRAALLKVVEGFVGRMTEFHDLLSAGDAEALKRLIVEGSEAKKRELADQAG